MRKPSTLKQALTLALCVLIPGGIVLGVNYAGRARQAASRLSSEQAFDQTVARSPYLKSIQKSAPAAFTGFRKKVIEMYQQQASREEIDAAFRSFIATYSTDRLKQASRADLLKYLRLRVRYIETLGQISPDYIYAELKRAPYDRYKDSNRAELEKRLPVVTEEVSAFLATLRPTSTPPKKGDIKRARKNMEILLRRIPQDQLSAVMDDDKDPLTTTAQKRLLYKGYVAMYREMLKLPEAEAVELYYYMENIPGTF